jgi:hypothetical protein
VLRVRPDASGPARCFGSGPGSLTYRNPGAGPSRPPVSPSNTEGAPAVKHRGCTCPPRHRVHLPSNTQGAPALYEALEHVEDVLLARGCLPKEPMRVPAQGAPSCARLHTSVGACPSRVSTPAAAAVAPRTRVPAQGAQGRHPLQPIHSHICGCLPKEPIHSHTQRMHPLVRYIQPIHSHSECIHWYAIFSPPIHTAHPFTTLSPSPHTRPPSPRPRGVSTPAAAATVYAAAAAAAAAAVTLRKRLAPPARASAPPVPP